MFRLYMFVVLYDKRVKHWCHHGRQK